MKENNNPFCSRNRYLGQSTSDIRKGERNFKIATRNLRFFKNKINSSDGVSSESIRLHNECAEFLRGTPHSQFHKDYFPAKKGNKKNTGEK